MQVFCVYKAALGLLFVIGLPVAGQVAPALDDEPIVELSPFFAEIITLPEASDLMGGPSSFLSGAELDRLSTDSLGETLSWQPGVSSTFYGPAASRPVIRGQGGYRVGVYSSGTQTGDLSASSPDHAVSLEPLFIEEVEIIRGPAALLYGSGSIGGAVNVEMNTLPRAAPYQPVSFDTELRYDTVNAGRTAGVAATVGDDSLAVQANGLLRETNSYRIPGNARTAEYDANNRSRLPPGVPQPAPNSEGIVPNTQSSTQTGSVGISKFWSQGWVGAGFTSFNTNYGVPVDGHAHGNMPNQRFGPGPYDAVIIDMQQRKGEAELEFWPDSLWLDTVNFHANYSDLKQDEFEGRFLGNHFDAQTFDTRLELAGTFLDGWAFSGGGSVSGFDLENQNINYVAGRADEDRLSTSSLSGAVFGFAQYSQDKWEAQVGARAEFQHAERSDLSNVGRNDQALSTSAGAAYRISPQGKIELTLSYLERVPTADELYVEAPHGAVGIFQIPNPDLGTEKSLGFDLTLSKDQGMWLFAATAFVRHFNNYIFLESQGFEVDGLPAYRYVQREANFVGAEIESSWEVYQEDDRLVTVSALWDVVYGRDTSMSQPLPRIPPMRLGARIDGTFGNWELGTGVRHAFAQNLVPQAVFGTLDYQSTTPAYTFVDANIAYTFIREPWEARLFINATNLTNAEGRNAVSFLKDVAPLPGRNFTLGVEIQY